MLITKVLPWLMLGRWSSWFGWAWLSRKVSTSCASGTTKPGSRVSLWVNRTDIPGPEMPLYLAGARLLEVFPMIQLLGTVTLAVGGMSYAGQFNVMAVADAQGYPDIGIFARGVHEELRALNDAV